MINPDNRLIIVKDWPLIRFLNNPTLLLNITHHKVEPQNTPITKITEEMIVFSEFEIPKPAKMAINDRMVIGFVKVKNKTDTNAFILFFF